MTIAQMMNHLRFKGFEVHVDELGNNRLNFIIAKGDKRLVKTFSYPSSGDAEKVNRAQEQFLDCVLLSWDATYPKERIPTPNFYSELKKADNIATIRAGEAALQIKIASWSEELRTDTLPICFSEFAILGASEPPRLDFSDYRQIVTGRGNGKPNLQLAIYKKLLFGNNISGIKNVIFNDPATIVFWMDGTKTVVKAENEPFDPEKGLAMAISKKALGNEGNYYNTFTKWLPKEDCQCLIKV